MKPRHFLPLLSLALMASQAGAALLVYEGFNGYTAGTGLGSGANLNPNANTTGLDTATAFGGNGFANYIASGTGMTFGSLVTTGGSVNFTAGTSVVAARMSLGAAYTGTLWNSYLIQVSSGGTADANHGFHARITNDVTTGTVRFQSFVDNRGGEVGTRNSGIRYADVYSDAGASLTLNTSYIIINSFTRVGSALSAGSPGVATMYALNLQQFGSMVASADWQNYLNEASQGTGNTDLTIKFSQNQTTGNYAFTTGNYTHFAAVAVNGSVDELRWGTDLASVVPVPEPSTGMLALLGCGFAVSRRRRVS